MIASCTEEQKAGFSDGDLAAWVVAAVATKKLSLAQDLVLFPNFRIRPVIKQVKYLPKNRKPY